MSDDDSLSSEDMPLSALAKKDESESSDEAEFEEEDEDEEMGGEDSSDFIDDDDVDDDDEEGDYTSDSSDDAPLTSLKSKKKTPPPKKAKAKPAKKSSSKKAAPKKKAATSAKKNKSTTTKKSSSSSASNYLCASGELYAQCDKGKLIQSLLARWWYAYQWPDPKALPESTPKGYDALDGFPGVYICTQGSNVGKFLDKRDHTQSPSFNNFAKKNSAELKDILLRAIEDQLKVLIEHEGEGTDTQKGLRALEIWAMKLNCAKADKEAEKALKAKRLTLP